MWTGQPGDTVPDNAAEVKVLHAVTVDVDLIIPRQPLHLLNYAALRPMLLVQEGGDHRDAGFRFFRQNPPANHQYLVLPSPAT